MYGLKGNTDVIILVSDTKFQKIATARSGLQREERLGLSAVKLFSRNSNPYDHTIPYLKSSTLGLQTTWLGNTTLYAMIRAVTLAEKVPYRNFSVSFRECRLSFTLCE